MDALQKFMSANPQVAAALIGAVLGGGLVSVFGTRYLQKAKEARDIAHALAVIRGVLRAQLASAVAIFEGQRLYVETSSVKFIWLPVFDFLLPSRPDVKDLGTLTAREAQALMSFYCAYQEHMGYIYNNSGGRGDKDAVIRAIGYDFSDLQKREWLVWSMDRMSSSAKEALNELG